MALPVRWTKADRRRAWQMCYSGALEMTLGVNDLAMRECMEKIPLQSAMYGIGLHVGMHHNRIAKARDFIRWLSTEEAAKVYSVIIRGRLKQGQNETIEKSKSEIRIYSKLKGKIEAYGMPEKLV